MYIILKAKKQGAQNLGPCLPLVWGGSRRGKGDTIAPVLVGGKAHVFSFHYNVL